MKERVIILDFGSQFTQLIARRVRELNVYCEILPFSAEVTLAPEVKAVILSGSPCSVRQEGAPTVDLSTFFGKVPLLGVCYGAQMMALQLGGKVEQSEKREYGHAKLRPMGVLDPLLSEIPEDSQIWMSHADTIMALPKEFELLAGTDQINTAVFRSRSGVYDKPVYGLQFHPEVTHTVHGLKILKNFIYDIAGCEGSWTPASFATEKIAELKETIGSEGVLMGLSGGVDSTVAATLLHRAIGDQLVCFFIDNGLLRKGEFEQVLESYHGQGLNVVGIDARDRFLNALAGVSDPEGKRKIIGREFIRVFEEEAKKLSGIKWLGQGTIYPDVIESVSVTGPSVTIKSHHNVGGLPDYLHLEIIEPLRSLFKDEVRKVGHELEIPGGILNRHPFPGPGLAIRILGDITAERVQLLQEADAIFIDQLKSQGHYDNVWQAGVMLLPIHSVGVMGDERTYEQVVALRSVDSHDGMTATWSPLPHDFLSLVSTRIINEVKGINRVVYDISTKPPATIEWE